MKSIRLASAAVVCVLVVLAGMIRASLPARAAGPWYVAPGGNDANSCLSPAAPCATINGAIGKASSGDTVYVALGTYTGTGDQVVLLNRSLTLSGGWNAAFSARTGRSTIDGEGTRRGINVDAVTAVIDHFVVTRGRAYPGGGIANGGNLTLNDCVITENSALGFWYSDFGGGIITGGGTTLTLNDCAVTNNVSDYRGGGIYSDGGTVTLSRTSVSDNSAPWGGGGLFNYYGTMTLRDCAVYGNSGGGIQSWTATMTIVNSTINGNSDGDVGISHSTATLYSVTATQVAVDDSSATARNSLLVNCSGAIGSAGYNLIGSTDGCTFSPSTGDLVDVDPRLGGATEAGTRAYLPLLPGSPAVNAGNPAGCADQSAHILQTDQRGKPRFGRCDIGAYELQPIGFSAKTASQPSVSYRDPVTFTITLSNGGAPGSLSARLTDTLPITVTYIAGSLSATGGTYGYAAGVITWTGTINAAADVRLTFSGRVNQGYGQVTNAAAISGNGETVTRTAAFQIISPVRSLALAGPSSGRVWVSYPFSVTVHPVTATLPITFSWQATGQPAVTHTLHSLQDEVSYAWVTPGTKSVAVTATNSGGAVAATHTFQVAPGDSLFVAPGGSDSNSCLSPSAPCATINGAIGKGTSGDTIYVAVGTYTGSGLEVVLLDKSVTLSGGWDAAFATQSATSTVDGQDARRGIVVQAAVSATMDRFTIQNGFDPSDLTSTDCSGILNYGTVAVSRSSVVGGGGSSLSDSGVIHNYGTMTLSESTVRGGSPGGIVNDGTITLTLSTVRDAAGTGILNWHPGKVTLIRSLVAGNGARGIRNASGTVVLSHSTVSRNNLPGYLECGGGIHNWVGTVILDNSTVSGNTSAHEGGGICVRENGQVVLSSSTVSGNAAGNGSGGIRVQEGMVTLRNSIVAGNIAGGGPDCSAGGMGTIQSAGYNLIGNTAGCAFVPGTGDRVNVDARLGPLEGSPGYHPLLPTSPAIDAGKPAGCTDHEGHRLTTDQRGLPRVGRCDMGAYEAQPIDYAAKTVSSPTAYAGTRLTYTISLRNPTALGVPDAQVSDVLPPSLTYVDGSLTATGGSYGYSAGVITWTGTIRAGGAVTVSFRATASDVLGYVVNSAVIRGGGAVVTRSVAVQGSGRICGLDKHANPVLSVGPSGSWDSGYVWMPVVVKEGGLYRMWYTGGDGVNPSQIGMATSTDGVTWTKHPANPVLYPDRVWEAGGIWAGSVISESGVYRMWYAGRDAIWGQTIEIGHATSPDGIVWTRYPDDGTVLGVGEPGSWEDAHVSGPSVLKDGDVYHLWYTGDDGITPRLGHATSNDGILWIKDPSNPVLNNGATGAWDWLSAYAPRVVAYGSGYLLWYSGQTLPTAWQTGYAISLDGRVWTRKGLLIPEGPAGHFDAESADYASVVVDGAGFKAWYSGLDASGTYRIGYAAEVCGTTPSTDAIYLPVVMRSFDQQCPPTYVDSFGSPASGWPISDNSNRRYAYLGGEYQIWAKKPSQGWLVTPGAKATNYTVAVDARRMNGSSGAYGIVVGINEEWSEYCEAIVEANYYSIWQYSQGSWTALQGWTSSDYIQPGTDWNRLKVVRSSSTIAFYANGHHLVTVPYGLPKTLARIGLVAYSPSTGSLDARFDDFALYPARCGVSARAAEVDFEMGAAEAREVPVPPALDPLP